MSIAKNDNSKFSQEMQENIKELKLKERFCILNHSAGTKRVEELRDHLKTIVEEQKKKISEFSKQDIKRINRFSLFRFNRQDIENFVHKPFEILFTDKKVVDSAGCIMSDDVSYYLINLDDFDQKDDALIQKTLAHESAHTLIGRNTKSRTIQKRALVIPALLRDISVINWLLSLPGWVNTTIFGMAQSNAMLLFHAPQLIMGLINKNEENTCDKIADYVVPEVGIGDMINSVDAVRKNFMVSACADAQPLRNTLKALLQFTLCFILGTDHPSNVIRDWRSNLRCLQINKRRAAEEKISIEQQPELT